jgi:hypothetical protein
METIRTKPLEQEINELRAAMRDAYTIIRVLNMDALDNNKENWPRADDFLDKWKEFGK